MKPFLLTILFIVFAIPSFAQIFGKNYNPGTYYTQDGQKHIGYLAMNFDEPGLFSSSDKILYFKTSMDAKREKIKASTIMGFVVANKDTARTDSFVSVHPTNSRIKFNCDFIQVICDNGVVKLYNYRIPRKYAGAFGAIGAFVTYNDNYYFYGANADTAVEMERKDFIDVMSKMLADDPEIVAKIQSKDYTMGDMHRMLKLYYTHKLTTAR